MAPFQFCPPHCPYNGDTKPVGTTLLVGETVVEEEGRVAVEEIEVLV